MAVLYKPSKHAIFTEGESLTEQEHIKACDANLILRKAMAGQPFQGSSANLRYGDDDVNRTLLTHLIDSDQVQQALAAAAAEHEFESEKFLDLIPEPVKRKFNFKVKKSLQKDKSSQAPSKNDDKTTKNDELHDDDQNATKK